MTDPRDDISDFKSRKLPYAVAFSDMKHCPACRLMKPRIDRLKADVGASMGVAMMDIATDKAAAAEYKVREIPQIVFFRGDEELKRFKGFVPYDELLEAARKIAGGKNG